MFVFKDTRGKDSTTLFFVRVGWAVITVKFALAGLWTFPPMTASEYGAAFVTILAPWLGREWIEKK